jgi:hypothetical protein
MDVGEEEFQAKNTAKLENFEDRRKLRPEPSSRSCLEL